MGPHCYHGTPLLLWDPIIIMGPHYFHGTSLPVQYRTKVFDHFLGALPFPSQWSDCSEIWTGDAWWYYLQILGPDWLEAEGKVSGSIDSSKEIHSEVQKLPSAQMRPGRFKPSSWLENRGFCAPNPVEYVFLNPFSVAHQELQKSLLFHFIVALTLVRGVTNPRDCSDTFRSMPNTPSYSVFRKSFFLRKLIFRVFFDRGHLSGSARVDTEKLISFSCFTGQNYPRVKVSWVGDTWQALGTP